MADDTAGYRKITAGQLSREKQQELHAALQRELTEALIRKIQENPPEIDLHSVKLVLKPNQKIADWTVAADCGTCSTCNTCGTCTTCSTHALPKTVPKPVIQKLGAREKIPQK